MLKNPLLILLACLLTTSTISTSFARNHKSSLKGFHTFEEIEALLLKWQKEYPEVYRLDTLTLTHLRRPIYGICITDKATDEVLEKPEVLYVGAIHGCEPLASEVMIRWMAYLLENGEHPYLRKLVQENSLWMIPVLNPDGHCMHMKRGHKIWKANGNPNRGAKLRHQGVDLNRNFGYQWGADSIGSRPRPGWFCYGSYRGQAPFSEPESRAVRKLVRDHRFVLSFSFHSFGNKYLYPYNYSRSAQPEDLAWYQEYTRHLSSQNGYTWGNPSTGAIYQVNGDMDDWLYGDRSDGKNKTLALTVELGQVYLTPLGFPRRHFRKNLYACLFMAEIADDTAVVHDKARLSKMKSELKKVIRETWEAGDGRR